MLKVMHIASGILGMQVEPSFYIDGPLTGITVVDSFCA